MNLKLTGNHVEITEAMREYVSSKLSKITRHFDHVIDVSVILSVDKLQQKAKAEQFLISANHRWQGSHK